MGEKCAITSPTCIFPTGWGSNRPPFGYKSVALTNRARLPHSTAHICAVYHVRVCFPNLCQYTGNTDFTIMIPSLLLWFLSMNNFEILSALYIMHLTKRQLFRILLCIWIYYWSVIQITKWFYWLTFWAYATDKQLHFVVNKATNKQINSTVHFWRVSLKCTVGQRTHHCPFQHNKHWITSAKHTPSRQRTRHWNYTVTRPRQILFTKNNTQTQGSAYNGR